MITIVDIQVITKNCHLTIFYLYILFVMLQKAHPFKIVIHFIYQAALLRLTMKISADLNVHKPMCTDYHQGRVNLLLMHIFIQSLYNYNDDLGHDDVT